MAFYPDGVTMQHATMTGQAVLTTTDASGARSINASWIDLFTGKDGHTVTKLEARDNVLVEIPATKTTSARTITSATLTANGDEKRGLTSARFDGSPCFREGGAVAPAGSARAAQPRDPGACTSKPAAGAKPAGPRTGTSRTGRATTLVLKLAGQLDAIQALFQQKAVFGTAGCRPAPSHPTTAQRQVALKPKPREPRHLSRVQTADLTVDARDRRFLETEI